MKIEIKINNKPIKETKLINVLYTLLGVFRKIIIIPIAILHLLANGLTVFILINLLFGLTKANKYMDNIALNWMELFSNDT